MATTEAASVELCSTCLQCVPLKCAICRTIGTDTWCTCNTFICTVPLYSFGSFSPHLEASFHCKCLLQRMTANARVQVLLGVITLYFPKWLTPSPYNRWHKRCHLSNKNEPPFLYFTKQIYLYCLTVECANVVVSNDIPFQIFTLLEYFSLVTFNFF